ncbi:MAG: VOC family protein [Streptosporangiaceae bacterium]
MPGGIHHSVVVVRDLEASLRFYRDGLGLDVLADRPVEGDWTGLLGAPPARSPGGVVPLTRCRAGRSSLVTG